MRPTPTTEFPETPQAHSVQRLVSTPFPKPYYDEDGITLYNADARDLLALLKADVMITDPPYGVNLGNHHGLGENRPGYLRKQGYDEYDDTPENYREQIVPVLETGIRMHDRAAIFGVVPNLWMLPAPAALGGVYLPAGCGRMPWGFQNLAPVLFYGKAPDLHLGSKATTIQSSDAAEKNGHPCPKPIKWMTWLVSLCSRPGETVLDPFAGSGTTLRAAKDLGRRAIGIEVNEAYCQIAVAQLAQRVLWSEIYGEATIGFTHDRELVVGLGTLFATCEPDKTTRHL